MKTKYARQIREAILRARGRYYPDYEWAIAVANELQYKAFEQEILREHRRDLLRELKRL